MYTANFKLPMLFQNQAMKELIVNESINKIDHLLNRAVIDIVDALPENPEAGDLYILSDQTLNLFVNNKWEEMKPFKNAIFYVVGKRKLFIFNQSWVELN